MKSIGQKIMELRKLQGLSQESLAEKTKVNLRTIQRIEKGENQPNGTTLKMICEALDITPEEILDFTKKDDKTVLILMHLSVLSYLVFPIGNIIVPLIFWLTKKDKINHVDEKGLRLLNFQLLWTILISFTLLAILFTARLENNFVFNILLYLFFVLNIVNILLAIIVTSRISNKRLNSFPKTISLIH